MTHAKDVEKEHTMCPFSKLKSTTMCAKKLTGCPVFNSLIKMGYLDQNDEWKKAEVQQALQKIKLSRLASSLLTNSVDNLLQKKKLPFTVNSLQKYNLIDHDASISREDHNIGDPIRFNKQRFCLIYDFFNNKKKITLKEFIEYRYFLYKKSYKENEKFEFGARQYNIVLAETAAIFTLLSKDNLLELIKLQKVFEYESLNNVKTNGINMVNFIINYIKCVNYWIFASFKHK